jgi:hypothetical protein
MIDKIKKIATNISFIVLLAFLPLISKAQYPSNYYLEDPKLFKGGIVVGANFGQIDGDRYAGYFKVGINAGAVLYTRLSDRFSLSMELLFSQKGARGNFNQNSGGDTLVTITKQRVNLNYAEIPVLLNIFDKNKSHVGLGMSYSQLISSDEKIVTNPDLFYDETKFPFKKVDLNIIASANMHLYKGLYANLRFQYSIIPIRSNIDPVFARSSQYNNMWVLRVMYLF